MAFDEVLSEVYELGIGVTRSQALAGERYPALMSELPRIPYLTSEATAEMALVGEMIADRAFKNLPQDLQDLASFWGLVDGLTQVSFLRKLQEDLREMKLLYYKLQGDKWGKHPFNEALPHSLGAYDAERLMPNCLGMAQILVGFARAAGVPHMLVDTLYQYDHYSERYNYEATGKLLKLIEPYTGSRRLGYLSSQISKYRDSILKTLVRLTDTEQAHHALAIRTGEGWWMVDPYFGVICQIDLETQDLDSSYEALQRLPRTSLLVGSLPPKNEEKARNFLRAINDHIGVLERLDEPVSAWNFRDEAMKCIVKASYSWSQDRADFISRVLVTAANAFYSTRQLERLMSEPDFDLSAIVDAGYAKASTTKRARNVAFRRLIEHLVFEGWISIVRVGCSETTLPALYECHHPAVQLGVRTVNHLAHHRGNAVPELIKYSTGQWILHDSLAMVERSGSKRLQHIAARRLRKLEVSENVLPILRPYLTVR